MDDVVPGTGIHDQRRELPIFVLMYPEVIGSESGRSENVYCAPTDSSFAFLFPLTPSGSLIGD